MSQLEGFKLRSKRAIITYEYKSKVYVRKYKVDIYSLQNTLKEHKDKLNITMRDISTKLNVKLTTVEHWFRTDSSFSIPSKDIWLKLKKLLNIKINDFDKSILTYETRYGNYDMANRVYHIDGIMPTITASGRYLITDGNVYRELQTSERLRLMGFDMSDYKKIKNLSSSRQIDKQAGNSIVVDVLEELFKSLFKLAD